jgi:hypothetical protein
MKGVLISGNSLANHLGVLIDKNIWGSSESSGEAFSKMDH